MQAEKPEIIGLLIEEMNRISWWHTIDLGMGILTPGLEPENGSRDPFLRIPEDLAGKIVWDVGAWDGKYSFIAEQRGADVVALDPWTKNREGIHFAKKCLGSSVHIRDGDIETEDLTDWADVIFCFGVLYHLKHGPMLALDRMFSALVPGGLLIVETALAPSWHFDDATPLMEFVEGERSGDPTNWWYPNRACMEAMLRATGFVDVEYTGGIPGRGTWHAKKP